MNQANGIPDAEATVGNLSERVQLFRKVVPEQADDLLSQLGINAETGDLLRPNEWRTSLKNPVANIVPALNVVRGLLRAIL